MMSDVVNALSIRRTAFNDITVTELIRLSIVNESMSRSTQYVANHHSVQKLLIVGSDKISLLRCELYSLTAENENTELLTCVARTAVLVLMSTGQWHHSACLWHHCGARHIHARRL